MLEITPMPLDSDVGAGLVEAVQAEYVVRYGGPDATPMTAGEFASPQGGFLVALLDGEPVACGGFRRLGDGVAEVKRMYVTPSARGRGLARQLLRALEEAAAASGCKRVILETGYAQPEAVGLYTSSGYGPVPAFGEYRCAPGSRHFGKYLTART